MKTLIRYLLAVTVALIVIGELVARHALGLGTPPLSVQHDEIEYMFAPDQDLRRFGSRQVYNEHGMRSDPVAEWGDARRVIVFGDSVLNGGDYTDHSALATTRASESSPDVIFANISANSWGPGNVLGYVETFGLFEADTVLYVLSSHDADDAPRFGPLNPRTHPTQRPFSP